MSINPILSVNNLTKKYEHFTAVDNLSFHVNEVEIFGFLGPNGAGKSTTINIISGLLKMSSGDVLIDGKSIRKDKDVTNQVGMAPQNIVIWPELTCMEQIEFMGQMYDMKKCEARRRGMELLDSMKLVEKKDKLAKTLSGGMKRRLNIILSLIHDPKILILDEPEAGLDPQSRVLVRDYIKSISWKKTIILTTHDMDEAERLSDRVGIIDHGKLLTIDTPDNLKRSVGEGDIIEVRIKKIKDEKVQTAAESLRAQGNVVKLYDDILNIVSKKGIENISTIIGSLKENYVEIDDIKIRKQTLEDVFIALTGRGLRE